MLTQDVDIVNGRAVEVESCDPRGYKTTDKIIKGFMIYKSGKNPPRYTAIKGDIVYEGIMDEIVKKINAYWDEMDAMYEREKRK